MTSAMSVYDFFGYTIPGGLYLFAIAYLLTIFQVIMIDFKSIEFSSAQIVVYTILAYIAGAVFDPFSYVWYQRFFKPDNISATTLEEFKKNNSKVEVKFEARDWPILLAFIRQESIQVAANIQRYQATFIMFRNIGFSLLIFSLLQAISLIVLMIINSFLPCC